MDPAVKVRSCWVEWGQTKASRGRCRRAAVKETAAEEMSGYPAGNLGETVTWCPTKGGLHHLY